MMLQYVYLLLLVLVLPGLFVFVATRAFVELFTMADRPLPRRSAALAEKFAAMNAGPREQELRERIAALELETRTLRDALALRKLVGDRVWMAIEELGGAERVVGVADLARGAADLCEDYAWASLGYSKPRPEDWHLDWEHGRAEVIRPVVVKGGEVEDVVQVFRVRLQEKRPWT